jgi:hypothetical protein
MRVYELLSALAEMPAGAEVEFHTSMTLDELTKCETVDSIDGKDVYAVPGTIQEAIEAGPTLVILYR